MDSQSQGVSQPKADLRIQISLRTVLNIYGIFLFLGLLISIYTHNIKDTEGFLLFILVSSVLYFLLLNLYFKSNLGRNSVFIVLCLIAVSSLMMVFYLQM